MAIQYNYRRPDMPSPDAAIARLLPQFDADRADRWVLLVTIALLPVALLL